MVSVKANNACGSSAWAYNVFVYAGRSSPSGGFAYPNPADNILNVDLDTFAASNSPVLSIGAHPTYDVRLYDGLGNMLRQERAGGGIIRFDVSNLPNGLYYLHIYDGVNSTPTRKTIIIQH